MKAAARLAAVGLEAPDYAGRNIGAVLSGAIGAIGAGHVVKGRDAAADRSLLGIPTARHAIVVVIDGLGHLQLEARRGHAPFVRGHAAEPLTAGFPTTTATSLALFGTGQPAGRTGMTGYTARNPRTGGLANLISWDGAFEPEQWQAEPSLLEELAREGVDVATVTKAGFAGSGLTRAALRGGALLGAGTLAQRIDMAVRRAATPGLTYVYWGEIDATGHRVGWQSEEWVAALEDADRELARCARSLPPGAVLVATADHGVVDVPGAPRWDLASVEPLSREVAVVAGEPRTVHLHVAPVGAADAADAAERVAARWREVLGDNAAVFTRAEAVGAGLFGPDATVAGERIGDVVVAMAGRATVVDSRTQSPASLTLVGMHGSLTPEELYVPLLIAG